MRKNMIFIIVISVGLMFVFNSESSQKFEDINNISRLDTGVKPGDNRGVKSDINFGKIPLYFITNEGQVNQKAKFYAKASRYTLWLTKEGLVFDSVKTGNGRLKTSILHPKSIKRDVSRMMFVNSNSDPEMVPVDVAKLKVNYFKGNDKSKWHCDVPTSMQILYKNLYNNIDLKIYGKEKQIEYDWIIKPCGNPLDIKFQFKNVKHSRIDKEGNLLIETDFGELMHKRPVSYQEEGNEKITVKAEFKRIAKNTYSFEVGPYDKFRPLIIDPVLPAYSTYLGGGNNDSGNGIAVDAAGFVYVAGSTSSTDFPTLNQYQTDQGSTDVFVTKLDLTQSGISSLIYSTYLGGGDSDGGEDIAINAVGHAYVTGYTYSTDFPTLNQYQGDQSGRDAFVAVLDTTRSGASGLLYSTYLGGGQWDDGRGIAVDAQGYAYVTGRTQSNDFPTVNQYQGNQGDWDAYVAKLDTTRSGASSLLYSTYLGGGDTDYGSAVAVDAAGDTYVLGETSSTDFPSLNQYQTYQGDFDSFVAKLDTTQSGASGLLYSTYLGGSDGEFSSSIAVDAAANAYVTGETLSSDFPTLNQYQAYQQSAGAIFVTRLDTTQSGASCLIYSTYLGGDNEGNGKGIAVDDAGNAYVTGWTCSPDFPIFNQYQTYPGDYIYGNGFVTRLDTNQSGVSSLIYSTFLGGVDMDEGNDIAVDTAGNAYVTGYTSSSDFPIYNQYQTDQGRTDAFVTKLYFIPTPIVDSPSCTDITYTTATLGGNVAHTNGSNVTERGVYWSTINGFIPPGQGTMVSETGDWGTGSFSVAVTGLLQGTTIYFKAFAVNSAGTGYSGQGSFTTPAPLTTPTVTTTAVSNITQATASSGGTVTSNGGTAVTARGVCWGTAAHPTIADNHTADGTGTGSFSSSMTGLTPGTTYHVRAYAVNSEGISYGNNRTFATTSAISPPIVTTSPVSDIAATTASSGGNVTSDGGAVVTVRGVCWSTSVSPTLADNHTADGTGIGAFTSLITGLTPHTAYYVRAYAVNTAGTSYGNSVSFTSSEPPQIEVNRIRLNFGAIIGGSQTGAQELLIDNCGGSHLNWTVSVSDTWIQATPTDGIDAGLVTVSVNPIGLSIGTYNGSITITDASASNSPQNIPVFLSIYDSGTAIFPFGELTSPIDGSTLQGSVPVTGWALDDTEVRSVKIYRDGNVYIGDAVFVEGARPAVEEAYPAYPFNYRAGWGYMMLTNFLPNGGNGTFVITAVAADNSGNEVILGSKTIICDNENAVKPFGAIDTPTQGGDASGTDFINFGWALTPQPNTIPADGSTIRVFVDGVRLTGNPVYINYREDIALFFPGYNNSSGAVGLYYLDTTLYKNGMHTIAWSVEDDDGNADGIGSRFFRVLNVENSLDGSAQDIGYRAKLPIRNVPVSISPVYLKRGYKASFNGEPQTRTIYPDKKGFINIDIKEDERIEIKLGTGYFGYILVDGHLRGLPVGSTVDVKKGNFYWQPGPGFIGEYRFVFVGKDRNGRMNRRNINIFIRAKF